jgi:hypothetical protein
MLQLLQYLVGTSIAEPCAAAETTIVHSVVGGPTWRGSSCGDGGEKGCRLRGRIWDIVSRAKVKFVIARGRSYAGIRSGGMKEGRKADTEQISKDNGYRGRNVEP